MRDSNKADNTLKNNLIKIPDNRNVDVKLAINKMVVERV